MNSNTAHALQQNAHADRRMKVTGWNEDSMNILIRTEGIELTENLRNAINRKIGRVRRYSPRVQRARVQLHKLRLNPSPDQFRATGLCELPGNDIIAAHASHDPVVALDLVAEKVERRLRKRKTARLARRVRHHRANLRRGMTTARALKGSIDTNRQVRAD